MLQRLFGKKPEPSAAAAGELGGDSSASPSSQVKKRDKRGQAAAQEVVTAPLVIVAMPECKFPPLAELCLDVEDYPTMQRIPQSFRNISKSDWGECIAERCSTLHEYFEDTAAMDELEQNRRRVLEIVALFNIGRFASIGRSAGLVVGKIVSMVLSNLNVAFRHPSGEGDPLRDEDHPDWRYLGPIYELLLKLFETTAEDDDRIVTMTCISSNLPQRLMNRVRVSTDRREQAYLRAVLSSMFDKCLQARGQPIVLAAVGATVFDVSFSNKGRLRDVLHAVQELVSKFHDPLTPWESSFISKDVLPLHRMESTESIPTHAQLLTATVIAVAKEKNLFGSAVAALLQSWPSTENDRDAVVQRLFMKEFQQLAEVGNVSSIDSDVTGDVFRNFAQGVRHNDQETALAALECLASPRVLKLIISRCDHVYPLLYSSLVARAESTENKELAVRALNLTQALAAGNSMLWQKVAKQNRPHYPSYWTEFETDPIIVPLPESSLDFKGVVELITRSSTCIPPNTETAPMSAGNRVAAGAPISKPYFWPNAKVTEVFRFQSSKLWQKYMTSRTALSEILSKPSEQIKFHALQPVQLQNQTPIEPKINECYLFYGTRTGIMDRILLDGFSRQTREQSTGNCVAVFTDCFAGGDNFVQCRDCARIGCQGCTTEFEMLVCRVILGRTHKVSQKLRGLTCPQPPSHMHSVAAYSRAIDTSSKSLYSEFGVFDSGLIYPEYIVRYTRVPPWWDYKEETAIHWSPLAEPHTLQLERAALLDPGGGGDLVTLKGTELSVDLGSMRCVNQGNGEVWAIRRRPRDRAVTTQVATPFGETIGKRVLNERIKSFSNWPYTNDGLWKFATFVKPEVLARLGFFHDPRSDHLDAVTCAFCGITVWGWTPQHNPLLVHAAKAPRCSYLDGRPNDDIEDYLADWKGRGTILDPKAAQERHMERIAQLAGEGPSRMCGPEMRQEARMCVSRSCFTID